MTSYTIRNIESILGISRPAILALVKAGFVVPTRNSRRAYVFTFQDVIVLRTAQALSAARIPPRSIVKALGRLRGALPDEIPLSGLRITAVGKDIVVSDGAALRHVESGQLLLDLEVTAAGTVTPMRRDSESDARTAEGWFYLACHLEADDPVQAEAAYRQAIRLDPRYADAYVNLGYLLHLAGRNDEAVAIYHSGRTHVPDNALLPFNTGVALEELMRFGEALGCYEATIKLDPTFADAYYNSARLNERLGNVKAAIRRYKEYRQFVH
jgi:tetratricopeptide (TPR) repeat protein